MSKEIKYLTENNYDPDMVIKEKELAGQSFGYATTLHVLLYNYTKSLSSELSQQKELVEAKEKIIRVDRLKHLKEIDELNTICSAERAKIERLKTVGEQMGTMCSEYKNKSERYALEITSLNNDLTTLKQEIEELKKEMQNIALQNQTLFDSLHKKDLRIKELEEGIRVNKNAFSEMFDFFKNQMDKDSIETSVKLIEINSTLLTSTNEAVGSSAEENSDLALYEKAKETVIRHQQCSVQFLQRKLNIPYTKAQKLAIDLYSAGVVGPLPEHEQYREVLIQQL